MKKIWLATALFGFTAINAQYAKINNLLEQIENKKGQNVVNENFDGRKFILIKDYEDHTERDFITLNGSQATYVEVFDDKQTGQVSSNVFTGDMVKTGDTALSFRFDKLEGEKINLPLVKNFILNKQKKIFYLVDINTKDRWIDENSLFGKEREKK